MRTNLSCAGREFTPTEGIVLKDFGEIQLDVNEQVTVTTGTGPGNDIVRKNWGFYLTNSLNHSLRRRGFRTALIVGETSLAPKLFIALVEEARTDQFLMELSATNSRILTWLDTWLPSEK